MNIAVPRSRVYHKALIIFGMLMLVSCTPYGFLPSADSIEREIRREAPIGSEKDDALRYFERKGVEHSDVDFEKYIMASVHHIRGTAPLAKKSLFIKIHYDDDGLVTGYNFSTYFTSF